MGILKIIRYLVATKKNGNDIAEDENITVQRKRNGAAVSALVNERSQV